MLLRTTPALLLVLLLGAGTARGAHMPGGGRGLIETPVADTAAQGSIDIDFWTRVRLIGGRASFAATPISVTLGPMDNMELFLSTSVASEQGPGIDPINPIVLGAKYRFVDEDEWMPGLAARLSLVRVDRSVDLWPELIAQKTLSGHFKLAAMVGYDLAVFNGGQNRRQIRWATGIEYIVQDWSVAAEISGRLDEQHGYTGGEFGFSQRLGYRMAWGFELATILRAVPVSDHPSTDLMFGLLWSGSPAIERDRDGDGVRDIDDACIFAPEDKNEWQDEDGCPDGGPPEGVAGPGLPLAYRFSTPTPRFRMRIPLVRLPGALDSEPGEGGGHTRVRLKPGALAQPTPPTTGPTEVGPEVQPDVVAQPTRRPGDATLAPDSAGPDDAQTEGTQAQGQPTPEVEVVVELGEGQQVAIDQDRTARVVTNPQWRRALQPVIPEAYVRVKSERELQPWERTPTPDKPYVAPTILDPGQDENVLKVPATADTVTFDKSLWTIAASPEGYGNAKLWPVLYLANLEIVEAKLRPLKPPTLLVPRDLKVDPDRLVADFFEMRRRQQESLALLSKASRQITLRPGQSLRSLAESKDIYGDARFWTLLYAANLDRIVDPDKVEPGTVLRVPR